MQAANAASSTAPWRAWSSRSAGTVSDIDESFLYVVSGRCRASLYENGFHSRMCLSLGRACCERYWESLSFSSEATASRHLGASAMRSHPRSLTVLLTLGVALLASACSSSSAAGPSGSGTIVAVGAENEYANVIGQVGGKYVQVSAIMSNPNTDPHTFEASASVARLVSGAQLVVQNGVGYDTFMNTIENAAPSSSRKVIVVQNLLGLPTATPNPHLWYKPSTMPAVANAIAADLAAVQPDHASYFKANAAAFINSLTAWDNAIAALKAKYPGAPVAT